jgi:uncharacterized membrane protein
MRKLLSLLAVFVVSLLSISMVSALDSTQVSFSEVEINGVEFVPGAVSPLLAVEEGEKLDIKVGLLGGTAGAKDIQVDAEISGYEYDNYEDLEDSTHLFDIQPNNTKYVTLGLALPKKLDKDSYTLRLRITDKNTDALVYNVQLSVEPKRHGLDIEDVAFSPGTSVKAGRSLLASVLLENYGDKTEKDVKVSVSIPALGVSATEYVDVVETENSNIDYEDVPEMFLAIPSTAAAGTYKVDVVVKYDDLRETLTKSYNIEVVENEMFQKSDKLVLAVGPEMQTVTAGKTATYGVALTNAGTASKAYTVQAIAGNGNALVSEGLVVLSPGQNKVVYVSYTPAADAAAGEQLLSVSIKSGSDALETVTLKANVVAAKVADTFNLRNGLEIALIVLVVLLVIIGLIVGFSRLRKDDEEEQTYY